MNTLSPAHQARVPRMGENERCVAAYDVMFGANSMG